MNVLVAETDIEGEHSQLIYRNNRLANHILIIATVDQSYFLTQYRLLINCYHEDFPDMATKVVIMLLVKSYSKLFSIRTF